MKKRNILAGLTALVMACTSFGGFSAFAEDTEVEVNPLAGLSADFQNWSLDENGGIISPEGEAWYKILSRDGGNASTIVTEADGNKYLQFKYTTNDGKDYTLRKDNLSITGSIVLSMKFRSTNPGGNRNFVLPIWGPEERVLPLHIQNGKINANNGGTATTISNVDGNVWYDFDVILHYDETAKKYKTYDIYMNGILKADGFAMSTELSKITNIGLLLSTAYGLGDTDLDDFSVVPYVPEHSRFKLYQDFEDIATGSLGEKTFAVPTGYSIGTASVNDAAIVEEASGNKVIDIMDKSGSKATQLIVGAVAYPLNVSEPFTIEARFKTDNTGLSVYPFFLYNNDSSNTRSMIGRLHQGKLTDSTGAQVGTYQANKWFNIKVEVTPDTQDAKGSYNLYLNDKLVSTQPMQNTFTSLKYTTVAEAAYANGANLYIDDLMIYPTPEKSTDVYSEDFSYYGLNNFNELGISGDINIAGLDTATTFNEINVIEEENNRVLRLKTLQNTAAKGLGYNLKNLDLKGKIVLEQDIKVSREDTRAIMFRLYDDTGAAVNTVWLDNNKRAFIAYNGSETVTLRTAAKDTWVNVKVVAEVDGDKNTTDRYDVYLDGELVAEKLTLGTLSSSIKQIQFVEYMCWAAESTALIDNLRVYTVPDTSLKGTISFTDMYATSVDALYPEELLTISSTVTNNTGKDANPVLLVAMYEETDDNSLKLLNVQSASFETPMATGTQDGLTISITLPKSVSGLKLKAFLWNGLDKITPVTMNSLEG